MKNHLSFQDRKCRRLTINIHPRADFRKILKILNSLEFPDFVTNQEIIKNAVLELLNNSRRAHREKNIEKKIILTFDVSSDYLEVSVKDFGGGFNPQVLPYKLEDNHHLIDNKTQMFLEYQKKHNYSRFGMGILLVKKVFPYFKLLFFDHNEKVVPWESGKVSGTLIHLSTGVGQDVN